MRGKLVLVNEGINFSMQQLRSGISSFLPVLGSQISGYQDMLESQNNSLNHLFEDMDNKEVDSNFESDTNSDNGSIYSDHEFDI